jgi:uncharacterized protein
VRYLISLIILLSFQLRAAEVQVPPLRSPVMDLGDFLTEAEEQALSQKIYNIHTHNGPQITLLTVGDLQGFEIEDFSIKVAEKWQLGTKEKDNGLLIVLSRAERKVRIEVGQGLEGDITDYDTARYTRDIFPRYFKVGKFSDGFMEFLNWVSDIFSIQHEEGGKYVRRAPSRTKIPNGEFLIAAIVFILVGGSLFFRHRPLGRGIFTGLGFTGISFLMGIPLAMMIAIFIFGLVLGLMGIGHFLMALASQGRSGGGGSGGGWSGGGGGFSGGGSSGDW